MPKLEIEMTEAELFALGLGAADPNEYIDNFATNRARVNKENLKSDPNWTKAAVALATQGGDASDDWAVLLKGRDMGLFLSAADQAKAQEAEFTTDVVVPDAVAPTPELVKQEITLRKIALVGASNAAQMQDII